ncbi:SDR family oxidoreductase [Chitinophaga varians]|uniref:SDR family oxidoreductase n=1 Tax=Chitinophaga varians TaxID=2202339 RepID=UPI00165F794A|nr:SDR family oxidoreductase [Chitinophaga varians]MBC9914923.1 SDR family oxidoreductase [Chitinophaga varians]
MKTIFITGASTGLGKATAQLFQSHGWKVYATMRNTEKGEELATLENVTVMELDVTNPKQINEVVGKVIAESDVDVVFNNAGYGLAGPLEGIQDEQMVELLNTNLLGVIRVTKAFIPYFREKRGGLFIATTSLAGLIPVPFNSIYNASKTGVEGWSEGMVFELGLFNIGIKTVAPGIIKSNFRENVKIALVEDYMGGFQKGMKAMAFDSFFSTSEEIATVVLEAATDGRKQLTYVAGLDAQKHYDKRLELGREDYIAYLREQIVEKVG